MASSTITRISGYWAVTRPRRGATSQRAVVPIAPSPNRSGHDVANGRRPGEGFELALDATGPLEDHRALVGELVGGAV